MKEAFVVQFPHPGIEHQPKSDTMAWNLGSHARKFMVAHADYREPGGEAHSGKIVFWGEWESQSRVSKRWNKAEPLPTYLHEPLLNDPPEEKPRQNTDPWVFGERFYYSNCKQLTNNGQTVTALQRLTDGSLILFGSSRDDRFILDTVFVIGRRRGTYTPRDHDHLEVSDAFRLATLESLTTLDSDFLDSQLTLYDGATPEAPFEGMFSFVPCLPHDGDGPRFARPAIQLPGMINPASKMSPNGSKVPRPLTEVREAWETVVSQVHEHGLLLGTRVALASERH